MNGRFWKLSENEYLYQFGFFGYDYKPKLQRLLGVRLKAAICKEIMHASKDGY
jgi:hypothetical protein